MELGININYRRKQFAGIGRDNFCDFQNGVKYQFPYPIRDGQLESIACYITEKRPKGLIGLKPLHRAKNVVLHHGQRKAGNLGREVYALTLAEVEQLFAIVISHFSSPSHGIGAVCLEETEREVRGKQSVPLPLPTALGEEQANGGSCELHVNGAEGAFQRPVVLGKPFLLELLNNLVSRQLAPLGVVLGLAELDHAKQMAPDVTAGNQAHKVGTGKPAVDEQVVKPDASPDGVLHHVDGPRGLFHGVLLDAFLDTLTCIIGRKPLLPLPVSQPLLLVSLCAFLPVKGEVEEQLAQPVAQQQGQALVA